MPGLTSTGFERKTLAEIRADLETSLRAALGTNVDLSEASAMGQVTGIYADALAELWEVAEAIYRAQDPDSASGDALDSIALLTGTPRRAQTYSTVAADCTVSAGFSAAAGEMIAAVDGAPDARFANVASVSSVGGGIISVSFQALEPGPIAAAAGTLIEIVSAVSGWTDVTNPADAVEGLLEETDAALRTRRESELAGAGSRTVDAIRAAVLALDSVSFCKVYENRTDVEDSDGRPPHSFETVFIGSDGAEVAATVFAEAPVGIGMHGDDDYDITDRQGILHTIGITEAIADVAYLDVDVYVDAATFVGATEAEQALIDFVTDNLGPGDHMRATALEAVLMGLDGVIDCEVRTSSVSIGAATRGNLTVDYKTYWTLTGANVTVTVTEV